MLLVIYGILTQTNIGKLFAAGILPGLVGIIFYMLAVRAVITIWPDLGRRGEKASWRERLTALRGVWGVLLLFAIVMGGIYGGVFTPTEAAGIGALGSFFFFLSRKETGPRLVRHIAVTWAAGTILLAVIFVHQIATGGFGEFFVVRIVIAALAVTVLPALVFAIAGWRTGKGVVLFADIGGTALRLGGLMVAITVAIALAGSAMSASGIAGFNDFMRGSSVFIAAVVIIGGLIGRLLLSTDVWTEFYETLLESALTTAMLFIVLIGALLFANFINFTTFPQALLDIAENFKESPWLVLIAILVIYVLLGCVFESLSMILLTVPIFFPLIRELGPGFGLGPVEVAVWYGIVVVVITEISLITPPVGLNVFVLRGVLPDVRTATIFRGVTAYWIADLFRLAVIVAFPTLSLFLPQFVK